MNDLELVPPSALEAISRAEVDIQIATAKKYPRELARVKIEMMGMATLDQETAEACFYTLPRGGKNIQGPSVRLAEIALACYGNARAGTRVIETVTTGDNPHVIVQGVVHDLQRNVSASIEKRRRIIGKKDYKSGGHRPIDEDDINLAVNSCSAIAFRDAVFKVVPGALVKPVCDQAKKVAIGDAKTLADRRARCIEAFAKMGVDKPRILSKLAKKSVEDIDLDDLETLLGMHSALRDGELTVDDAFPEVKQPAIDGNAELLPKDTPKQSPQSILADRVLGMGHTFTTFQQFGLSSGQVPNVDSLAEFAQVPDAVCKRLAKWTDIALKEALDKEGK
jgi:hypothetical protein